MKLAGRALSVGRALLIGSGMLAGSAAALGQERPAPTRTEIAPGIDLQKHVLDQAQFALRVADDLRPMDERIFRPEPMRLDLGAGGPA